ncbi:hypothetical protein D3C80_1048220 [compost metagenome]
MGEPEERNIAPVDTYCDQPVYFLIETLNRLAQRLLVDLYVVHELSGVPGIFMRLQSGVSHVRQVDPLSNRKHVSRRLSAAMQQNGHSLIGLD